MDFKSLIHDGKAVIPYGVTEIGINAFRACLDLTSIEIPNSVIRIGMSAFNCCNGLTSIEIPNSVTEIGDYAFRGCSGLTSIEIPNSVKWIGYCAFADCTSLTDIFINTKEPKYVQIILLAFENTENITLHVPIGTGYACRDSEETKSFKEVVADNWK